MEEQRLSRSYLETLSTDDLARLARRLGLELPEDLNRVFILEELLDAGLDEEEEEDEEALADGAHPNLEEPLPASYNETFIGVLLRDPVWAYAFWEIRQADREIYEQDPSFSGYALRVAYPTVSKGGTESDPFTIPVSAGDSAWYLCLPGGSGWFRVELLCRRGDREERLAVSSPFKVPRGVPSPDIYDGKGEAPPLFTLSGLDELKVLQGGDRESRLPQRCDA